MTLVSSPAQSRCTAKAQCVEMALSSQTQTVENRKKNDNEMIKKGKINYDGEKHGWCTEVEIYFLIFRNNLES
jgi:hypothetical protein